MPKAKKSPEVIPETKPIFDESAADPNEVENTDHFLSSEEVPEWVVKSANKIAALPDDGKSKIARNVWAIYNLAELAPSTKAPWRKVFRFTAEEFWGIFYSDGTPIPGQPFYRRVYRGMRGMLSNRGRLMIVCPQLPLPPPRKASKLTDFCLNTARAVINEFYKGTNFKVVLKNKQKQDMWEYLGINTPEVVKGIQDAPPKQYKYKKFRIKPLIKKVRITLKPPKPKNTLSYDLLDPKSYRARARVRGIENQWKKQFENVENEKDIKPEPDPV